MKSAEKTGRCREEGSLSLRQLPVGRSWGRRCREGGLVGQWPRHGRSFFGGKATQWLRLGLNRSCQRINHAIIRVIVNLFPPWCQGLLFTQHFCPRRLLIALPLGKLPAGLLHPSHGSPSVPPGCPPVGGTSCFSFGKGWLPRNRGLWYYLFRTQFTHSVYV